MQALINENSLISKLTIINTTFIFNIFVKMFIYINLKSEKSSYIVGGQIGLLPITA